MTPSLFTDLSPVAVRGRRTDRLILHRLLDGAAQDKRLDSATVEQAHRIVIRWADLESSGRLAQIHETQLQGDFLRDVFGDALGYTRLVEGRDQWQLEQHWTIPGNGEPDAIIGQFSSGRDRIPVAVIELKGPAVHLDRDRSAGRTAVQQCWEYLANLPQTRWAIVSNIVSFRLYERDHTMRRYEHFALQELRDPKVFRRFYVLLEQKGLLKPVVGEPRAARLLELTDNRQRAVGDELYDKYSRNRTNLIRHLHYDRGYPLENAIAIAQQLIDRIIFIAFCEDRELLPEKRLDKAFRILPPVSKVTNPRWQNYVQLFRGIDEWNVRDLGLEVGYNGGLFAKSEADDLDLDDEWTEFFKGVGEYDFRDEVNLDVLGHLFEKSITELERLREGDFFAKTEELTGVADYRKKPAMPQSAKRKRMGIYYTPPQFTSYIVERTVGDLITARFADAAEQHGLGPDDADTPEYWLDCLDILRNFKVCDPACGSGAFLFQTYELLESRYGEVIDGLHKHGHADAGELAEQVADLILSLNIYGVDLSPEAVEITQLALWIRSARRGCTLADLSHNIRLGNSLVHDPAVDSNGFNWNEAFAGIFGRDESGFDCIIGNPPWERMKLQEREFFSLSAADIATATNAAKRRKLVEKLPDKNPDLYQRYIQAQERAGKQLDYCRKSGQYPLTGKGDINTYAVFAELASKIVAPHGRVGLLVPSGIASDMTTKDFFAMLTDSRRLACLYDFENRKGLFEDLHRSFKFCVLAFGGEQTDQQEADFVFFAHRMEDLQDRKRHIQLSAKDIRLLNPNTRTCPIFRTRRDAQITKRIYRNVPVLIDRTRDKGGNPWGISFKRMFDQTNDAELFREAGWLMKNRYTLKGNRWIKGKQVYLPLYEGKMVQMYDHRAAGVVVDDTNWFRQAQTATTTLVKHQNPEFVPIPRWWITEGDVATVLEESPPAILAFKNVTSPTNTRTMIAALIPKTGVGNSAPLIFIDERLDLSLYCCFLANLNCFALDYVARQKIGNVNLNFFLIEQFPIFPPSEHERKCPWDRGTRLSNWISERVLKLTCTAEDMLPLAEACDFTGGTLGEYNGRLNRWLPEKRAKLMAELDAAFFILYGIDRDDAQYILSTFSGTDEPADALPGQQTTARRVLDAFDWLSARSLG